MDKNSILKEEIRRAVQLSEVIERLTGKQLKGSKMCCPFHLEKTPSFFVNDSKGLYHCFVCGGGDVFKFVMKHEELTFNESLYFIDREFHLGIMQSKKVSAKALYNSLKRNQKKEQREKQMHQLEQLYDGLCLEYRIASRAIGQLEVFSDLWCYYMKEKINLERRLDECMQKMFSI